MQRGQARLPPVGNWGIGEGREGEGGYLGGLDEYIQIPGAELVLGREERCRLA